MILNEALVLPRWVMSPVDAIRLLREVTARLAALEDGGGTAGQWFCDLLAIYEGGARHGLRLDEAARLIPKPGQDSWWAAERRSRRDELLRTIAVRWYVGERSPASKIATALRRYQAAGWLRDRPYLDPPKSYRGTVRELLFRTLKYGPAPGQRTIERALAHETPPIHDAAIAANSHHAGNEKTAAPARSRRACNRTHR